MKKETYQENLYRLPYHWMRRGYLRVSMEFRNNGVLQNLCFGIGQKILDLGCGDGYFSGTLSNQFPEALVVGADYNLRALRFARIMTDDVPYAATSAVCLGFKKESFDVVFLLDVIEHLDVADREHALEQAVYVLKPGGLCIVTVPSTRMPVIPMHYNHFSADELGRLMQRYLAATRVTGYCRHLPVLHQLTRFPVIWRIIYFTIRECDPEKAVTLVAHGSKAA
jgi:ubiquinone/menaquinone biosynthesis C-methylase UbiE